MSRPTVPFILGALAATGTPRAAQAQDLDIAPVARVAMGPSILLTSETNSAVAYSLDATAGLHFDYSRYHFDLAKRDDVSPGVVVVPEIGYHFHGHADELHAFTAALGFGGGDFIAAGTYTPRWIVGTQGEDFAIGMRNSAVVHFLMGTFTLEVGHQFVHYRESLHHDIRVHLGINPGPFILLLTAR